MDSAWNDEFEMGWASGLRDEPPDKDHGTRRLRVRVYGVNGANSGSKTYVALTHYKFTTNSLPAFCCEWFGRLFVLSLRGGAWTVSRTEDSLLYRGKTLRSFRLVDLDGDGAEEILVEAENTATGYRRWIAQSIFAVVTGDVLRLAVVDTLSTNDAVHTQYSKELNAEKTRQAGGRKIYLTTTEYGTETEQFAIPRTGEEVLERLPLK